MRKRHNKEIKNAINYLKTNKKLILYIDTCKQFY